MPAHAEPLLGLRPDSGRLPHVERCEEHGLASGRDDGDPTGLAECRCDSSPRPCTTRRRASRSGSSIRGLPPAQRLGQPGAHRGSPWRFVELEVALVEPVCSTVGRPRHRLPHRAGYSPVERVSGQKEDRVGQRRIASRSSSRRRCRSGGPRSSRSRRPRGRADRLRRRAVSPAGRVLQLLDGREGRVQVEVRDDHGARTGSVTGKPRSCPR